MSLKVLFVGGTGLISSACVTRAIESGLEVSVLNRGATSSRPLPAGARALAGDVRDPDALRAAVEGEELDVVADFIAFTPEQVRLDLEVFEGRVGQYVFISSASAYQKPVARLPIVESTPLRNPYWAYSRDKIACEELLVAAYRERGLPVTIVRPSHTYDRTAVPLLAGWTAVDRMRRKLPVVVHGDGTSLWVLTHHVDFAGAFVGLLGNPQAIGDTFHITGDEVLTWNQIYEIIGHAAGAEPRLVHVASEKIASAFPEWGPPLLGDMAHSVIFDNAKVKRAAPGWVATTSFARGVEEIVAWYDGDASRRVVRERYDDAIEQLVATA